MAMDYMLTLSDKKSIYHLDQHYNPTIAARLRQLFAQADWSSLQAYLSSLSNAHFRTAGYIIGERMLRDVPSDVFWDVMLRLVTWQPKAFLVTLAKSALPRLQNGTLTICDDGFARLASALTAEERLLDREKLLLQWLPAMRHPSNIEKLFAMLHIVEPRRRLDFLLRVESLAANFVLLRTLRFEEHDRELLVTTCRQLMRRGTSESFNMASLIREFFGLEEVRGVFSLRLEPYEMTCIDTDFDTFCRLVHKVR